MSRPVLNTALPKGGPEDHSLKGLWCQEHTENLNLHFSEAGWERMGQIASCCLKGLFMLSGSDVSHLWFLRTNAIEQILSITVRA
jgi:hypothetical protein